MHCQCTWCSIFLVSCGCYWDNHVLAIQLNYGNLFAFLFARLIDLSFFCLKCCSQNVTDTLFNSTSSVNQGVHQGLGKELKASCKRCWKQQEGAKELKASCTRRWKQPAVTEVAGTAAPAAAWGIQRDLAPSPWVAPPAASVHLQHLLFSLFILC